jgi:chloride channel 3/4/5
VRDRSRASTITRSNEEISKRPRVILVEKQGSLVGLITVKDVLRFIEREEAENHAHRRPQGLTSLGTTAGLEGILEETWVWLMQRIRPLTAR